MDYKDHTITLYTLQSDIVLERIEKDGVCFSKEAYVRKKYEESAPIFTTAYSWLVQKAIQLVPPPEGAEYPYWAFKDLYNVDTSGGGNILKLQVPLEEAIFFDVKDWNDILRMKYLGPPEKAASFRQQLDQCGLSEPSVMLSQFYPDWKQQILQSWDYLLRHHEAIKSGEDPTVGGIQAGLWKIKKEWLR